MKILPCLVPIILFALLLIFAVSAGCVSLGTQTTDIVMGNETVGVIQVVPQADGLYSVHVELFGVTFSKDGMTETEAESLFGKLVQGDFSAADFLPQGIPENAGTPSDLEEFIDGIIHMPITNLESGTLGDSFSLSDVVENANASFSNLENLVAGIFGI